MNMLQSREMFLFLAVTAGALPAFGQSEAFDSRDDHGVLRSVATGGNTFDRRNPFFQSLGTNGRSCSSCHVASSAWTVTPGELRRRFLETRGLDPVFRTIDGANSPDANVSTMAARRAAYSQLLSKGVFRIGLPIPANSEFTLDAVDDPYHYASAAELSLFRRPLPATNLRFLTAVMWEGRESFGPLGTFPIVSGDTPAQNAEALFRDLKSQANDATMGHAQGLPLTDEQQTAIVNFELNIATAQEFDDIAGQLSRHGGEGGAAYLADQLFYVTINDALGADVMTGTFNPDAMDLFQAWLNDPADRHRAGRQRASIARGAKLFGNRQFQITNVGGLNDVLGIASITGTCTTCHDAPNVGDHSVALPIDIGITDEAFRTPDMPLYTLRNIQTGATRKTTDPGRALLTGKWSDIGKFKGPVLRGLAARPPYFHNGHGTDLEAVIDFYETRFGAQFTDAETNDLINFLNAL